MMKRKRPSTGSTNAPNEDEASRQTLSSLPKKTNHRRRHRNEIGTQASVSTTNGIHPWKSIDVSELKLFSEQSTDVNFDENHYDNEDDEDNTDFTPTDGSHERPPNQATKKMKKKKLTSTKVVERELLGQPHEPMGIFYSLEVMDGATASSLLRKSHPPMSTTTTTTTTSSTSSATTNDVALVQEGANSKKQKKTVEETISKSAKPTKKMETKTPSDTLLQGGVKVVTDSIPQTPPSVSKTQPSKNSTKAKEARETMDKSSSGEGETQTTATAAPAPAIDENDNDDEANHEVVQVQNVWFKECNYSVQLHTCICHTLLHEQFHTPTMIQSLSLPATILGQQNFVGAAPTGSGKTLAFLLPIFHAVYSLLDQNQSPQTLPLPLQALIVTPTRELALQIYHVGMKFCIPPSSLSTSTIANAKLYSNVSIACITGGLASAKQIRILQSKYRPPTILVGTPGRLWELISSQQYEHLNNLSQLRFLVIDEADQMVDMKSSTQKYNPKSRYKFPELIQILDVIHKANPMMDDDADNDDDKDALNGVDSDDMDANRMFGLPGIPGEARVTMMNDAILQQIKEQQQLFENPNHGNKYDNDHDVDDDDDEEEDILITDDADLLNNGDHDDDDISLPVLPPVRRQTFVFSATLTLPESHSIHHDNHSSKTSTIEGKMKKKKHKSENNNDGKSNKKNEALSNVHGAIADLLQKAHAVGRTKVVDLTNGTDMGNSTSSSNVAMKQNEKSTKITGPSPTVTTKEFQFPPGLQFQHILCTQRHKDSHLYGYILYFMSSLQQPKRQQSHQSSILIFCNSIAGVRRVGMTLTTLRLPVRMLHANMQQRARFKAVESLQQDDNGDGTNHVPTIVVATDVAARGLDIPSVATVIHYDAARTVDTFIHRSGRTARGIGDSAVGCSVSIVASGEDQVHNRIKKMLNVQFQEVPIDGRLFRIAQERVNLACKVATADDTDRKNQRDDQWFIDQAKQAGLEVDDDLLNNVRHDDDDIGSRRNKDSNMRIKARQKEAEIARQRLQELLSQPVQTQRYSKFYRVGSG